MLTLLVELACTGCGRIGSHVVGTISRSSERRSAAIMERDLERDSLRRALKLPAPGRVFKYTTEEDAQEIHGRGFVPGMHFTSNVKPRRPLTPAHAAVRYGLAYEPATRLAVTLPAGVAVKANKVIGGAAGYGELRIDQSLPADSIEKAIDISKKH